VGGGGGGGGGGGVTVSVKCGRQQGVEIPVPPGMKDKGSGTFTGKMLLIRKISISAH